MKLTTIISLLSAGLSISCGESSLDAGLTSATVEKSDLEGTWVTKCYKKGDEMVRDTLAFTSANRTLRQALYQDSACTDLVRTTIITSTYILQGEGDIEESTKITYTVVSVKLLPASEVVAADMNQNTWCESTDWTITEKDVSGGCSQLNIKHKNGVTTYDIINVANGSLFMGLETSDVTLEANRPTEFDPLQYNKQ